MISDRVCAKRQWSLPLLAILMLLIASGASGFALTHYGPACFDAPLLVWFRAGDDAGRVAGPEWAVAFWLGLTWLGDTAPRIAVAGLTIGWLLRQRRPHGALFLAGLLLSGIALSTMLKQWVGRPRPQLVPYLDHVGSQSFPSGHALNSTVFYLAVALLLARYLPRRARWALFLAATGLFLATGVSRIALGVHYPTDVIAGWIVGAAWVWVWFAVAKRCWPKALA